jgi:two-component system, cell cycle sensor histidine kinase and response regulator CckA
VLSLGLICGISVLAVRAERSFAGCPVKVSFGDAEKANRGKIFLKLASHPQAGRRLALSVAAGLAGLLLNHFSLDVFGGARMSFGEIFSLTIALQFGPLYGVIASIICELPMLHALHPATGFAAHVIETLVVGWCARRRILPMVADAAFWCAIGAPLVLAAGPPHAAPVWAILIKNLLNGLLNVTLADLLTG